MISIILLYKYFKAIRLNIRAELVLVWIQKQSDIRQSKVTNVEKPEKYFEAGMKQKNEYYAVETSWLLTKERNRRYVGWRKISIETK